MMNTSSLIVHGIPSCGSVKNAQHWLKQRGVSYQFHDFKKQGVSLEALAAWAQVLGWDRLINRQGTTWRKLSDEDKALLSGPTPEALQYVQAHASLIKRPLIQWPAGELTIGMDESVFARLCA